MIKVIFGAKTKLDTYWVVYPFAKELSPKINELQAITFDKESASDAQKLQAPPKRRFSEKKIGAKFVLKKIRGHGPPGAAHTDADRSATHPPAPTPYTEPRTQTWASLRAVFHSLKLIN